MRSAPSTVPPKRETGHGTRETCDCSERSRFPFLVSRFPTKPLLELLPPVHSFLDGLFVPELRWFVPLRAAQRLRQAVLRHIGVLVGVRVLAPGAVAQL